jgi:hypothetical protein
MVTSLKSRQQPTLGMAIRDFFEDSGGLRITLGSHPQPTEKIHLVGIESGRDQNKIRPKMI